jgi:hypothetical protein
MYIRTREEAKAALAALLAHPAPQERVLESALRILQCLDPAARELLCSGRDFLLEGGLQTLRHRREALVTAIDSPPQILLDPDEAQAFEEVAAGYDALRMAGFVREIFPDLRAERWKLARLLLEDEERVRSAVLNALLHGSGPAPLERRLSRPDWVDQAGRLRSACRDGLRTCPQPPDPEWFNPEVELLFELTAVSDRRVHDLLKALEEDRAEACRWVRHLEELVQGLRALDLEPPPHPGSGPVSHAA